MGFGYICLMNVFQAIFKFYLRSSIHVGFAVVALIFVSLTFLNITPEINFLIFIFSGTLVTYNFIKYGVEARKYILVSNSYHRVIQVFSLINLGIALFLLKELGPGSWLVLLVTALFTGAYALPVYPRKKNLRNYGVLKVFLVALVWTLITQVLPMVHYQVSWGWDRYIDFLQRFLLILVLMVPFELRDLKYDPPELGTFPQRFGEGATKWGGMILAIVYFLLTFLKDDLHVLEIPGKLFLLIALGLLLGRSGRNQSDYFASFWVEGLPIAWGVLLGFFTMCYPLS